tara:strand:+ start:3441 stop:4610 length:1170 start_codon:yes stop_codon:yes gene_type:complete
MATTFKTLTGKDKISTKTLLHESIPLTGTIASGTYSDNNIKNYSHKMFQSVYDYPYLSSSANHIFDISYGYSSVLSGTNAAGGSGRGTRTNGFGGVTGKRTDNAKKLQIYNSMAQVLVGHDTAGSIRRFDRDGNFDDTTTDKMDSVFFLNFSRLLTKDEIKKGTFSVTFMTGGTIERHYPNNDAGPGGVTTIQDISGSDAYLVNSPAGEYGILYDTTAANSYVKVGLLYYHAGIAVITSSIFGNDLGAVSTRHNGVDIAAVTNAEFGAGTHTTTRTNVNHCIQSGTIQDFADGVRNRLCNVTFNNTVELNSSIYFCRLNHNDFNYSANPTYVSGSKIVTKRFAKDQPVSYLTTVGLYSADNELLAVAKVSEPLRKDPNTELTLRVRLDY